MPGAIPDVFLDGHDKPLWNSNTVILQNILN